MDSLRIIDGRIVSGHFIFIRDSATLSDAELLSALELVGYTLGAEIGITYRHAHILRSPDWTAYADDGFYTAYNSSGVRDAVARLGRDFEVLRVAIGDSDESFEFYHFVGGTLCRAFHFHDYAGRSAVRLDSGSRMRCESAFQLGSDPTPFIWALTDEIGVDVQAMTANVTTYSLPYERR
jgi:hypothetical protein